jgi:hypothetical protein
MYVVFCFLDISIAFDLAKLERVIEDYTKYLAALKRLFSGTELFLP